MASTSQTLSRRRVLAGLAGGALAAPLAAACGAGGASGGSNAGAPQRSKTPVTLRVMTWTNIINIPTWQTAFQHFNDAHSSDKITLSLEHVPDDYDNKLIAAFAGGAAPDVIYESPAPMQGFANRGITRDLSPDIKADKFILSDINPPAQLPYM